jgi:hypothetical protein
MAYSGDPSRRHAYRRQQRLHPRDRPGTLALEMLEFPRQPPHALGGFSRQANRARAWRDILCIQEERIVGDDNTVKWKRLSLQIPTSPLRPLVVRGKVRAHEYPDGALAVCFGPVRLADYDASGAPSRACTGRLSRFSDRPGRG